MPTERTGLLEAGPQPPPGLPWEGTDPRFVLLGPLEIHVGQGTRTPHAHKPRVLLAILLARHNTVVSTDRLIAELWGDRPPRTALKALRVYVSQLRRILAALPPDGPRPAIVTRAPGYRLESDEFALDASRFRWSCELGRMAGDAGDLEGAVRHYRDAIALWRGSALIDVRSSPLLAGVAQRLEESRVTALERCLEMEVRLGRHTEAVAELRALAADHPLRERIHYQLMLALSMAGRRGEALQAFQDVRGAFVTELGVEPGRDLQVLHQEILTADRRTPSPASWERRPRNGHQRLVPQHTGP